MLTLVVSDLGIDMSEFRVKRARVDTVVSIDDEIKRYESFPAVSDNTDVLLWWKSMSSQFPVLSKVARDLLAIPGSSASSERAFSAGGNMITKKRASLGTKTVQAAQCLRSWMKMQETLGLSNFKQYKLLGNKKFIEDEYVDVLGIDLAIEQDNAESEMINIHD